MTAIRTALPADREAVIDLMHELNRFEQAISGDRRLDRAAAEECYAELTTRIAERQGRLLVAVEEGVIVGCLGLLIETDEPFVAEPLRRYGLVTDLVVREEWRGRGVGRALIEAAEVCACEAGLKRLMIGVLVGNAAARRAYAAAGFQDYLMTMVKEFR